jgi:lauroyl/myristoyl acyltransferase
MDAYHFLDNEKLRYLWTTDPKWHKKICVPLSLASLMRDRIFNDKAFIRQTMRKSPDVARIIGRNCTGYRFAYMNYFYAAYSLYNYGWLLYSPVEKIKMATSSMAIIGLENLDQALGKGCAIVAFSAHIGCFFNILFCDRVLDVIKDRSVALLVPSTAEARRRRMQVQLDKAGSMCQLIDISSKVNSLKVVRALRNKSIVGCNLDYAYPFTKNKVVNFMGRMVEFPVGLLELGRRIGVTFLPCFSYLDNGKIVIEFQPPTDSVRTACEDDDIQQMSQEINAVLERKITQKPEQWSFWERMINAPVVSDQRGSKVNLCE